MSRQEAEELTEKGSGIGILPAEAIADDLKEGTLKMVRTTSLPDQRKIYLAMKPGEIITDQSGILLKMIDEKERETES